MRWSDRIARVLITAGGLGTVVAVLGVCVFLVASALPLFAPARVERDRELVTESVASRAVATRVDDDLGVAWTLNEDGSLVVSRFDTRTPIRTILPPEGPSVTAIAVQPAGDRLAFGFADGSVRPGRIEFRSAFFEGDEVPDRIADLEEGAIAIWEARVVRKTPEGQFRIDSVDLTLDPVVEGAGDAVAALDLAPVDEEGAVIAVLDRAGRLTEIVVNEEYNYFTGASRREVTRRELPAPWRNEAGKGAPQRLVLTHPPEQLYCVWDEGAFRRLAFGPDRAPEFVEEGDFAPGSDRIEALVPLIGRRTLAVGTREGRLSVWFGMSDAEGAVDGQATREARVFRENGASLRALAVAARSRLLFAADAEGALALYQATTGQRLLEARVGNEAEEPIRALAIAPRQDALIALTERGSRVWDVDLAHPEVGLRSLFLPVHYEGYAEPAHVWQSSSGSDEGEPKFGFLPLVFGTLKATFYTLLFGAPLALLAALYSSEFLAPRSRARIKPAIELMASLPSVVLGFLAALVFAPFVERVVPAILGIFLTVPFALVLGAFLWQLAPRSTAIRFSNWRPVLMCTAIALGVGGALAVAPLIENALFAGDIMAWLDGRRGTALGGWMLFTLPIATLVVGVLGGRASHPLIFAVTSGWSRVRFSGFEIIRCLVLAAAVVGLAALVAWLITGMGFDPRGGIFDTYVQRNSLVVGFVMGFAVIPIIFTIAEDALTAVPSHLRAASLGAGATPWQTAVRIIVPTAASGLFSAVMIGFGRAVGETMIVLMATGNTPIMDVNVFNGFRTLAANIAVEMPEAAKEGTHYRTLYLAALVLFALTFAINALAESIRQRFRRRAYEL